MEQVAAAAQAREERLAGPERRQQRRDRRLQRREEVGDVGQRLDAQQLLGLDEPQQQHEAGREQQPHQHQDVAGAPGRKHVDEQQRDGRCPRATGMTANGTTVSTAVDVERRAARTARARCPTSTGTRKIDDHPRRLADRPQEARVEQPARRDRRGQQQPQILGQERTSTAP